MHMPRRELEKAKQSQSSSFALYVLHSARARMELEVLCLMAGRWIVESYLPEEFWNVEVYALHHAQ